MTASYQTDKYVCDDCFKDYAIKKFIIKYGVEPECTYCGRVSHYGIAVHIKDVADFIVEGIDYEWNLCPEVEGIIRDEDNDSWYSLGVVSTHEILREREVEGLERVNEDILCDLLIYIPDDERAKVGIIWGKSHENLLLNWENFCYEIKHRVRYLFLSVDLDIEEFDRIYGPGISPIPIVHILKTMASSFNRLGLLQILDKDTIFYRARGHQRNQQLKNANDLGTTPIQYSKANRMSPVGIPMFYAAFNEETAIKEIISHYGDQSKIITIGKFKNSIDCKVLDLTSLPNIPSIFDQDRRSLREEIMFLTKFRETIERHVQDNKEIDYIPTQVFTEYIRYIFRDADEKSLSGIIYPSVQHSNGKCCVLFVQNEDCCDVQDDKEKNAKLKLILESTKRVYL